MERGERTVTRDHDLVDSGRGSESRAGGGRSNACCSVLYAAYYPINSSRDSTVLMSSSLSASPAWLDMVRQMNRDVTCDSTVWTDFGLTTETAYPSPATDLEGPRVTPLRVSRRRGPATKALVTTDEEFERGGAEPSEATTRNVNTSLESGDTGRTVSGTAFEAGRSGPEPNVAANNEDDRSIPQQAKRVLRRYFYDEYLYRLATGYGLPTLTVFRDRLRRGVRLDEDDRNHRWFVDAMLSGTRFVAAVEMKRPSAAETAVASTEETAASRREEISTERQEVGDERAVSAERDVDHLTADDVDSRGSEVEDDDYVFDEDYMTVVPPIPERILRSPEVGEMSEGEMTRMFDQYENELRNREGGDRTTEAAADPVPSAVSPPMRVPDQDYDAVYRISAVENRRTVSSNTGNDRDTPASAPSVTPPPPPPHESVLFKRPYEVAADDRPKAWTGGGSLAKRRRLFRDIGNGGDDASKENQRDTGHAGDDGRTLWDASSESDDGEKLLGRDGEQFDVIDVEPSGSDEIPPTADRLSPNTVLLVYRVEWRSGTVTRFVLTYAVAAADSEPPIDPADVRWNCDELLRHLRKVFGGEVQWLGRRQCNPNGFQLRNQSADGRFARGAPPNLHVVLRRPHPGRRGVRL